MNKRTTYTFNACFESISKINKSLLVNFIYKATILRGVASVTNTASSMSMVLLIPFLKHIIITTLNWCCIFNRNFVQGCHFIRFVLLNFFQWLNYCILKNIFKFSQIHKGFSEIFKRNYSSCRGVLVTLFSHGQ